MIVMNQIKKKVLMFFGIGLVIGIVIAVITGVVFNAKLKGYESGEGKEFKQIYMTPVYKFNRDIIQGEVIQDSYLESVYIHKNTVPIGAVVSTGSIVGQAAKFNIPKDMIALDTMSTATLPSSDLRVQEYNMILLPTDIREGDVVDIRLQYPNGQDYVVLTSKEIKSISGNTIWLDVREPEIQILSSAIIDSYLTEGTKIYAVKYADAQAQVRPESERQAAIKEIENRLQTELYGADLDSTSFASKFFELSDLYAQTNKVKEQNVVSTYQPNEYVLSLIGTTPNINAESIKNIMDLTTLPIALRIQMRSAIDSELASFKAENKEDFAKIPSKIQESITAQNDARTKALGT